MWLLIVVKVKEDMTGWKMWEHGVLDSRLIVIKQVEDYIRKNGTHSARWLCECTCKNHTSIIIRGDNIRDGRSKSCGCLNLEKAKEYGKINGNSNHKQNSFTLYDDYGIGISGNTLEKFFFDIEDYNKIKDIYWNVKRNDHNYHKLVGKKCESNKEVSMAGLLGYSGYDHVDRNPLNNRKSNFRIATKSQQSMNRNRFVNNSSGFIGISWRKREEKWYSYIQVKHNFIQLGYFVNKYDAIIARLRAEQRYFGEFAPQRHLFTEYGINEKEDDIV